MPPVRRSNPTRENPAARSGGQNPAKVEQVNRAQGREARRGELEDDETRARLEHSCGFAQAPVQVGEIAYAKSHQRAIEPRRGERQCQRVGGDRHGAGSLVSALRQHRHGEVGADHAAAEAGLARQLGGEIEGAGAEIEIRAVGFRFPAESRHGGATPGSIHVETQQVVQEVVARGNRREHTTDVGWRTTHRRER